MTHPVLRPSWLGLLGIAATLLGLSGGAASPPLLTTRDLVPGDSMALPMGSGEVHKYQIHLEPGQIFEAVVRQHGTDLGVELTGPGLPHDLKVSVLTGSQGFKKIFAIARASGLHQLRLVAPTEVEDGAFYVLCTKPPRQFKERDRAQANAFALFLAGEKARQEKNWEQALREYQHAIETLAAIGETELRATAFYRVGWVKEEKGDDLEGARDAYEQALSLSADLSERVIVTGRLSSVLAALGDADKALQLLETVLESARRTGDAALIGAAYRNTAILFDQLGQSDRAIEHADAAWKAFGKSPLRLRTLIFLGRLYYQRGDIRRTLQLAHQVEELDRNAVEGPQLIGKGLLAADAGVAARFLSEALERAAPSAFKLQAEILCDLGSALLKSGRVDDAEAAFQEGRKLAEKGGFVIGVAYAQSGLGHVLRLRGDHDAALASLEQSAASFQEHGTPDSLALVLSGKALAQRDGGDLDGAYTTTETATKLIEEQRRRFESLQARASFLGAWAYPYEIQSEILLDLDQERPGQGYAERALETGEEIRARALFEGLSRTTLGSPPEATQTLLRRQEEISGQLRLLEGKRAEAARESDPARLMEIEIGIQDLLRENESLREEFFRGHPRYAELARPDPLSSSEIQGLLDPGTALLAYTLGDERSVLCWVEPGSVTLYELGPRSEIEGAAARLHHSLQQSGRRTGKEIKEASRKLSELVLGPVAERLARVQTLVVVPDGTLQTVPFGLLPSPGDENPLVSDHVFSYLPSASILALLRRRADGRSWNPETTLAAFAYPVLKPNDIRLQHSPIREGGLDEGWSDAHRNSLPDLPMTEQEAREISEMFPGGSWTAIGLEAVPEVVKNGQLRDVRYIHFGTHGVVHQRQPELSGIVLSQFNADGHRIDGRLRLYDILALDLTADLVSLSTCRSAAGPQIPREGPIALSRSFLFAGATRVLGTLWEVEDGPAYELTTRFYRGISQGKTPAEALRDAQSKLMNEGKRPQDWAAFVLQGDWR